MAKQDPLLRKYNMRRHTARKDGHEWAFTFESWRDFWRSSGHIDQIGYTPTDYCMVRLDPIEAWGPHNCIIVSRRQFLKRIQAASRVREKVEWRPEDEE